MRYLMRSAKSAAGRWSSNTDLMAGFLRALDFPNAEIPSLIWKKLELPVLNAGKISC